MTPEKVRGEWKAFVYGSEEALSTGMIDRIATLNETLTRVLSAGNADDQRAARDFTATPAATLQEPSPATSQEPPVSDSHWQNAIDRELLELDF